MSRILALVTCLMLPALPALGNDSDLWRSSLAHAPSSLTLQTDLAPQQDAPTGQPVSAFDQQTFWLQWQAQSMDKDWTAFGGQLGYEARLGLGYVRTDDPQVAPLAMVTSVGMPLRFHTFNVPVPGSLAAHVDAELALGGGQAWSSGVRLSALLGLRATLALTAESALELDWTLAPQLIGSGPNDASLAHTEHRIRALFGIGAVAGGVGVVRSEQTVAPERPPVGYVSAQAESWTVSVFLQRWFD